MTICIAAVCHDKTESQFKIVMCADKRVENDISGSEIGHKVGPFKKGWWTMYSGIGVEARELTWLYHSSLKDEPLDADVSETLRIMQTATDVHMSQLTEKLVRSQMKMSYEEFISKGPNLPKDTYESVLFDIQRLKLNFTLVIGGFIENSPELFVVEPNGKVRLGDYWEAIGSGAPCAQAMLFFRGQEPEMSLEETIYHLFEAKSFSEDAGGVGEATEIYVLGRLKSYLFNPKGEAYDSLKEQYSRFGPQKVVNPHYPVKDSRFFSAFPNEP